MQRHNPRGLAVALTAIGLAACTDPVPLSAPRATESAAGPATSGSLDGATTCTPCPPGVVCAAVCDTSLAIESGLGR